MSQNLLLVYNQFTLDFKQLILTWLRNRCNESAFNEANSNWEKNVGKYLLFFQFFHKETFMHFTEAYKLFIFHFSDDWKCFLLLVQNLSTLESISMIFKYIQKREKRGYFYDKSRKRETIINKIHKIIRFSTEKWDKN